MEKSTFTPLYETFRSLLLQLRRDAGLTQRGLASKLGREPSFVARIEQGERRVDVVELYWICRACGASTSAVVRSLVQRFDAMGVGSREQQRPAWGRVADPSGSAAVAAYRSAARRPTGKDPGQARARTPKRD